MTPEQIEKWSRQASAIGDANELSGDAIAEFARLVAADTWERARNVCFAVDETGDYVCHTRDDCANAIDAAAAQEARS